jgi:hypothetical protein
VDAEYHGMNWDDIPERDKRPYMAIANEIVQHPKYVVLTPTGKNAIIELLAYCNTYLTDGAIPEPFLKKIGKKIVNQLLQVGWIETTSDPKIFQFHDYLKHQKSREEIIGARSKKEEAGIAGAHERWHVRRNLVDPACALCSGERSGIV